MSEDGHRPDSMSASLRREDDPLAVAQTGTTSQPNSVIQQEAVQDANVDNNAVDDDSDFLFKEQNGITLYKKRTKKTKLPFRQLLGGIISIKDRVEIVEADSGHMITVIPLGGEERIVFLPSSAHTGELQFAYLNPVIVGVQNTGSSDLPVICVGITIEGKSKFRALMELLDKLKVAHRKSFPGFKRGYYGPFVNRDTFFLSPGVKFSTFGKRMKTDWIMVGRESMSESKGKTNKVEFLPLPYLPPCEFDDENKHVFKNIFESAKSIGNESFVNYLAQCFGSYAMALRYNWVKERMNMVPIVVLIGPPGTFKSAALQYFKSLVGMSRTVNLANKSGMTLDNGPWFVCDDPRSIAAVGEELKAISDQSITFTRKRGYESKAGVVICTSNRRLTLGSQEPLRLKRRLLLIPSVTQLSAASAEDIESIENITCKDTHVGVASNIGKMISIGSGLDSEEAKEELKKSTVYVSEWLHGNNYTKSVLRSYSMLHYFIKTFLKVFKLTEYTTADQTFIHATEPLREYLSESCEDNKESDKKADTDFFTNHLLSTLDKLMDSEMKLTAKEALYSQGLAWNHATEELVVKASFIPKPNKASNFIKKIFPGASYNKEPMGDDPNNRPRAWRISKSEIRSETVLKRLQNFATDYNAGAAAKLELRADGEDIEIEDS